MKTGEAEKWLRQELTPLYEEREAAGIASMVLEKLTGQTRSGRLVQRDEPLPVQQLHELTAIHHRLLQHEPVQYVLGEAWFWGMKLYVDKHVLIPRPETEELAAWIRDEVKALGLDVFERRPAQADRTASLKILDVGTGSGCIALALKKAMPKAEVWGTDISDAALNIARRNGSELDIRVDFVALDFLDAAQRMQLPTVDILVSNPPYVLMSDKGEMRPNVVRYEPHTALFVSDSDPLLFYRAIAQFGKNRLYEGGRIFLEIHEHLGSEVVKLFEENGYKEIVVRKDMQGKDRMVRAVL